MGLLGRRLTDKQRAEELFSPYLDGQVTDEERMFLERYLAAQPQAREKFELLKAAVQLTKSLPPVKAPRSFVLPRSLAHKTSPALRVYPLMRLATVAAMALFAFAFVGDLATQSRFMASAPAEVSATRADMQMAATVETTPAAPEAPQAPEATPGPPAALEAAAPAQTGTPMPTQAAAASGAEPDKTADAASTPEGMARQAAAPTPAATEAAQPEAAQADQKTSLTSAPAPATLQLDPLRLAWIMLAGLALLLTATTLIVRRHR